MAKGHPVTATIVAAVLGAAVVIVGYSVVHKGSRASRNESSAKQADELRKALPHKVERGQKSVADTNLPSRTKNGAPVPSFDLNKAPPMPGNLPDKDELREQFNMLRSFLELPPERLARIHQSIERIEAMKPEQKERMLAMIREADKPADTSETRYARVDALLASMPEDTQALIILRTKNYTKERRATFIEGYASACEDVLKSSSKNAVSPSK